MAKRPRRRQHIPRRACVACQTVRAKRDMVRIVRTPEGAVVVDETGKLNGRGAYLCRQRDCWDVALAKHRVERALKVSLNAKTRARLREWAARLPQYLLEGSSEEEQKHLDEGTVRNVDE